MKDLTEDLSRPRTLWIKPASLVLLPCVFGLLIFIFVGAAVQEGQPWYLLGSAAFLDLLVAMLLVRLRVTEEELVYYPFRYWPFRPPQRIKWNEIREIRSRMEDAGSGASYARVYVWVVTGRDGKEKLDINTSAFPVENLALLAQWLEQKAPRASLSQDVRHSMKRWRDSVDPTLPKHKSRVSFWGRSKARPAGTPAPKTGMLYRNLLVLGIALFVLNWFFGVFHHTDFQIARNLDLDAPKAWGWKLSSGLSLFIYLVWLTKVVREKKATAGVLLKGALIVLVIVNYVLAFLMKNDVEAANALMDTSPSQTRVVTVSHKYHDTVYGRNGSSEYFYVCFPDQDGADFSLYVDYGFCDSVKTGSQLRITTHAGHFGWPWIEKFEKLAD